MERPVPAPREGKKPVPTPRRHIGKSTDPDKSVPEESVTDVNIVIEQAGFEKMDNEKGDQFDTFSRRVNKASRQIAGDLGQLVQDRKKAVIEGTRQSMRRLTRRFSSASQEQRKQHIKNKESAQEYEGTLDMFNNIRFDSPISRTNSIYSNVENELNSDSSSESINLPPPKHPPPPLPDENFYDAPSGSSPIASSSNSSKSLPTRKPEAYESVFPKHPDSENALSSSGSWTFYDSVNRQSSQEENIYYNILPSDDNSRDVTDDCSMPLIPDKTETKKSISGESHANSIYENHQVPLRHPAGNPTEQRASKSVLMQFDPLNDDSSITQFSDMNLLEEILQGDLYGNISEAYTFDEADWSVSNESENEDFLNPPTPPLRFDSLPEDLDVVPETSTKEVEKKGLAVVNNQAKSRSSWFTDTHLSPNRPPVVEPKKSWLKQVKQHVLEKTPEVFKSPKCADNLVERPILGGKNFINKKGMLYKVQGGPVEDLFGEYSGRWWVLENSDLFCYSDNTCMHLKEHFSASSILSIQLLQDAKYKYRYDSDDLHCFELNITGKGRGGHVYGSKNITERRIWLQCLAEMLTQRFKSRLTTNFLRMGWAYVRQGVSGKWAGAWLILSERELYYAIDGHSVKTIDLRKARCIVLQGYQEADNNPRTNDKGPNMLVDCPDLALYLRMWTARETKVWCHIVKLEAHNNGANLDQQQLTKNDIPVIVEKCINFIYAHGSMSEGIYRKAGTGSSIADLLTKFRKDAFAVQLTRDNYSEYEVGTALKRFFRELPEPLFGCDHRQYLYEVAKHNVKDEKIRMFKAALDQLPSVSYKTARKLLGHLHFISNQSAKNLMTVENLASIWGMTLMNYEDKERPSKPGSHHLQDAEVVAQLIRYYRAVFPEDPGELEKEKLMLKVLQKHMQSPQGSMNKKTAGDFRVWIYLFNKDGKSYNVSIGPQRTAYEVCLELSDKIKSPVHEIILEESVLGDKLLRPIHHTEKVLDVVLKWSYWNESDRKDNYLTCVSLSKYWEYILEKPLPISGELKFADSKTKLLKVYNFQFTQGCLSCFKDKSSDINLYSWRIEDITWYLGHESKRSPQSRWTATFLEKDANPCRTRTNPYFGNILVWNDAAIRANWISAMLKSRYPNNLTPPPKLVTI
ncbi:unnamed protein product [Ceutorhynchus assimilis]|uniref:Arf-GAP with Rho-GAP domain, ANK repeat and PH domain-containing protein 2 n=1 Tax=Ceutorhynchus assimilis TaxID=467358 RepID=A0A9N9MS43_9CUCU|nr:unnamed protein product [Ceutorhynchus assimilis]